MSAFLPFTARIGTSGLAGRRAPAMLLASAAMCLALPLVSSPLPAQEILPAASPDADALAAEMRVLASNPTDVAALIRAGELALKLEDPAAAAGFFARADRIDPSSGRTKAGFGTLLVQAERPGEALRRFAEAEQLGWPPSRYAADRGLAYDLLGEQERAQRDYRLALRTAPNDETVRRYALSLGISGLTDNAMALLDPLLRRSDRAAWRARAFILAMAGDVPGANNIAATMMPAGMAQAMQPFFARLPLLRPVDRAFAVHFGEVRAGPARLADARLAPPLAPLPAEFPPPVLPTLVRAAPLPATQVARAAPVEVRRDRRDRRGRRSAAEEPVLAASAAARPAGPPPLPAPPAYVPPKGSAEVLIAATSPVVMDTRGMSRDAQADAQADGRRDGRVPDEVASVEEVSKKPVHMAEPLPPVAVAAREASTRVEPSAPVVVAAARPQSQPSMVQSPQITPPQAQPTQAPPIQAQPPQIVPPATSSPAASPIVTAATRPEMPAPVSTAPVAPPITTAPITTATSAPAASPPAAIGREDDVIGQIIAGIDVPGEELGVPPVRPRPEAGPALPPVERAATTVAPPPVATPPAATGPSPAEIAAEEKKLAEAKKAEEAKKAAEAKKLADKKAADKKAAELKKKNDPKILEPSRIWVQVAGGANEDTLGKEWARVKAKAPAAFKGKQGWTTPLRFTNRVLAGPFKTDAEARAFVNQLAKEGLSAFTFTSEAGQKITKLALK